MPDLEAIISRLIQNEVDFVLVGGLAGTAHGTSLVTQDIDICCEFSRQNLPRLQAALADLHPVNRASPARPPLELTPETASPLSDFKIDTDCGQLDCRASVAGVGSFDKVKRNTVEVQLPAGSCRILSLDALIKSKEAMGRPRDHEAILQLRAIRERLEQG